MYTKSHAPWVLLYEKRFCVEACNVSIKSVPQTHRHHVSWGHLSPYLFNFEVKHRYKFSAWSSVFTKYPGKVCAPTFRETWMQLSVIRLCMRNCYILLITAPCFTRLCYFMILFRDDFCFKKALSLISALYCSEKWRTFPKSIFPHHQWFY